MREFIDTQYSRDDVYSYKEAADIIGVAMKTLYSATEKPYKTLTVVRLSKGAGKFLLKSEIDALAGLHTVRGRLALERLKASRMSVGESMDMLPADVISEKVDASLTEVHTKLDQLLERLSYVTSDQYIREMVGKALLGGRS